MAVVPSSRACPGTVVYEMANNQAVLDKFCMSVSNSILNEGTMLHCKEEDPALTQKLRGMREHGYIEHTTNLQVQLATTTHASNRWSYDLFNSKWRVIMWNEWVRDYSHLDLVQRTVVKPEETPVQKIKLTCRVCIKHTAQNFLLTQMSQPLVDLVKGYLSQESFPKTKEELAEEEARWNKQLMDAYLP